MQSNMVSPFSLHQQQIAMLAQQQSLLMAAAANASAVTSKAPGNTQLGLNGTNLPTQSWPNAGYQFPGMMTPGAGKIELENYTQVREKWFSTCPQKFASVDGLTVFYFLLWLQMGNTGTHPLGNSFALPTSRYVHGSILCGVARLVNMHFEMYLSLSSAKTNI